MMKCVHFNNFAWFKKSGFFFSFKDFFLTFYASFDSVFYSDTLLWTIRMCMHGVCVCGEGGERERESTCVCVDGWIDD